jgi:hypothetical protein
VEWKLNQMATTFANEEEFRQAVSAGLGATAPAGLVDTLSAAVVMGEKEWRAVPARPGETALNLKVGRFIIRDEDLPFIETIGTVATTLAGAGTAASLTAAALIPAITGLATIAWNLWRRGLVLSRDELALLGLLRSTDTISSDKLLTLARSAGLNVDSKVLEHALKRLTAVTTRDGTEIHLAKQEDGLWRALPI